MNIYSMTFFFSGHRYPPPPLSLRNSNSLSEGASPNSFSPDSHRAPPHSASARVHSGHHFDLSLGTMSKTPSSSTSGGGSHFTFNEATNLNTPPPRPPPHQPINSVSHDAM